MTTEPHHNESPEAILAHLRQLAEAIGYTATFQKMAPKQTISALPESPQHTRTETSEITPKTKIKAAKKKSPETPRSFQFTDRDFDILKALNRYRYLRTGQVKRLLFPDNKDYQSTRRRLRCLASSPSRYLLKIEPYVQVGKGSAETAYALNKAGIEYLKHQGEILISYAHSNSGRVKHQFLEHALDLSEFRIHLERALHQHESIALHRFVADFEIKKHIGESTGRHAYTLYHELIHPRKKNTPCIVYPDALIILQGKGEFEAQKKLFFLEVDRGTESSLVIREKMIGYQQYSDQKVYQKYGSFSGFRVLLQTHSPKRAENLRRALVGTEGETLVWISTAEQVTENSILYGKIWQDAEGNQRSLLKGG